MLRAALGFAAAGIVLARTPAIDPDRDPVRLRTGIFLYASPGLQDPRFAETVVLLLEHGPGGSLGVVINRPTDRSAHRTLDLKAPPDEAAVPLYWGGPVQPEVVLGLVRAGRAPGSSRTVFADVHLAADRDAVRDALENGGAGRLRVYSGYAGWGAGQLADEVRAGAWVLDRADAASVFSPDPSRLWRRVYAIRQRLEARAG
jgi:putative transcriptional regulator